MRNRVGWFVALRSHPRVSARDSCDMQEKPSSLHACAAHRAALAAVSDRRSSVPTSLTIFLTDSGPDAPNRPVLFLGAGVE